MASPYTTERGQKADTFRDNVENVVATFPDYWAKGPMNHTLYAAVMRGILHGDIPVPPEE